MQIWKGDGGTLSPGMSTLQRTKKIAQKRSQNREDASGKIAKRSKDHKAHVGIYKDNK